MDLNKDGRSAKISISGEYTATELEALLVKLMTLRANMQPEVPSAPKADDDSSFISCQEDGGFALSSSADGRTRLFLRHSGLGWLAFTFGVQHALLLRDYLVENTRDDERVHLISEKGGGGGAMQ